MLNRWFFRVAGAVFALGGIFVWFSSGIDLPTRFSRPMQYHFMGLSLLFLGLAPFVIGATLYLVADRPHERNSRVVGLTIAAAFGILGLAVKLADMY